MRTVNKVIIVGNLTRDPLAKETQGGQRIVSFGVATNRDWSSNGEKKSDAEFHEVVAWAHLGDVCEKYLRKGKLVYLEGYLKTRTWETETGDKRFRTEIVLTDMIMLNKKEGGFADEDFAAMPEMADDEPDFDLDR